MSKDRRRQYGTGSIYQRADGRWVGAAMAGWTAQGTRRRITVVAKSEAEAKRRLNLKRQELAASGADALDVNATVKTWSATWLNTTVHTVRPATWTANRSAVKSWIVPTIGHRKLSELTPGDVRAVHAAIRGQGLKASSIVRTHGVLSKMLHDAITEGHVVPSRVVQVRPPRANEPDRDAIPLDDAIALLTAASKVDDGSRWAAALLQGMRQGECLGLTWSLVDLERNLLDVSWQLQALPYVIKGDPPSGLRVPDGYEHRQLDGALCLVRPKTAKGRRVIPLVPWMASALEAWRQRCPASPHDLVWPRSDGRPALSSEDRDAWYTLQAAAEVTRPGERSRYVLHEARHATATLLLEAGVDPEVVKAVLGHSSIVTSRGYQHVSHDLTRVAMERIADRLQLT